MMNPLTFNINPLKLKKMKKQIISWGMMLAAAFTLTNCAKEFDSPQETETAGYPFEIVASTVDTKTVNDGMSTKWASGDQINVFHALGDDTEYVNDGAFTVSDVENGVFTGTINVELDPQEEYDWYLMYPYSDKFTTPGAKTAGYTYIGYSSGLNQTGYNSMASLKGSVCPLYGVLKYGGIKPVVKMQHLSSVVAINVTNKNDEPLIITNASFTATEDIVGSYYIDITGDAVDYEASDANYVKNTAIVNVSNGTALAKGESAILYAAIKPFTAAAGQKLTLSVNGYSKDITLEKDVTFTAGKIKTLNFAYDYVAPAGVTVATLTFDNADKRVESSTTKQVWKENDITLTYVQADYNNSLAEYVKPIRFYKGTSITIEVPGNIAKIEFTCNSTDYAGTLNKSISGSSISGNIVTIELDGTSKSVTYKMSEGQVRMDALTVTYNGGEGGESPEPEPEPEARTLVSIAVADDAKTEYYVGEELVKPVVTATYDNGSTANVTASATFSGYDKTATGTQTVTVSYTENEVTATDSYTVTVSEMEEVELTVAEFVQKPIDDNTYYILKGTITRVDNTTYGNFDLTDDTGTVYIYGLCSKDGATNKYWSTSGAKLGDDIVISTPRADFNDQPQGKNARFISLSSPGTRAFYTLSTSAVDFQSAGGSKTVTVTAYNTTAAVTASSDNPKFAVAVSGYTITITSVANELEESVQGNVTVTVGNLPATIIKVSLAAKPASGIVEGGQDDFHTISSTNTSYVSGTTTAGWKYTNCAIFKGGTSDSSPAFKMIGDASNRALCMNGKTTAKGSITSPTLTTGCGTLKFNYGLPFGDTKIKFKVEIKQNGTVVKTITIDKASATKYTKYSHEEEVNVAGDFQIVFTNLSPSNSSSNKDRTAIWDVEWTGCN